MEQVVLGEISTKNIWQYLKRLVSIIKYKYHGKKQKKKLEYIAFPFLTVQCDRECTNFITKLGTFQPPDGPEICWIVLQD